MTRLLVKKLLTFYTFVMRDLHSVISKLIEENRPLDKGKKNYAPDITNCWPKEDFFEPHIY